MTVILFGMGGIISEGALYSHRYWWGRGQMGATGLKSILVCNIGHKDRTAVRSRVAILALDDLHLLTLL
jgi:hypothetical protein